MGFWKDVAYDISRGMSEQDAINLNATLRYGTDENEKRKASAIAEAELKLKSMR